MILKTTKDIIALINSFYFYILDTFNNSKKTYLRNTKFYQSSNSQVFQGFAPFEPTEAILSAKIG